MARPHPFRLRFQPAALRGAALLLLLGAPATGAAPLRRLDPCVRAALLAELPERVQRLQQDLPMRVPGLAPGTTFRERSRELDPWGETLVRFQQVHEGRSVYGALAVARMDAGGRIQDPASALLPDVRLASGPDIGPDRAIQEVLEDLALSFQAELLAPPAAEAIVFPAFRQGWIVYEAGPQPGVFRMDPSRSVLADPLPEPFVPAYRVRTRHLDPVQGLIARDSIVDARTGQILRKDQGLRFLEGPVTVQGRTQYSGEVLLDAYQEPGGRYLLRDTTRPRRAHPLAQAILGDGLPPANTVYATWTFGGSRTTFGYGSAEPAFGDGAPFNFLGPFTPDLLLGHNGQTAAADVAHGMRVTWDLMDRVLGRSGGPMGDGEALLAEVHLNLSPLSPFANAQWDPASRLLGFGDGGSGYLPFTPLDVVAHEMGHALMTATADVVYEGEPGGLSEANSDIFATAAKAYALAGASGTSLPETLPEDLWLLATQIFPEGSGTRFLRSLMKPSRASLPDAWYDGIELPGVYYAAGPVDRFFCFLAEGSLPGDPQRGSAFLPGGMAGIGVQKALAIWYRALTAHVVDPFTAIHGMRAATETGARELFGEASPELRAVQNAWAAVAVGPAAGQATAPRLRIDPGPWPQGLVPGAWVQAKSRDIFVAFGAAVPLPKALAEGFPEPPRLRWSSSFAVVDNAAGTIRPSIWNFLGWSTSFELKAEGTPYSAQAMLTPVVVDLDGDGECDAADAAVLGIYAMTGHLPSEVIDPTLLQRYLPAPVLIYRWNRAFEALAATTGR